MRKAFPSHGVNIVVTSWSPVNNKNLWQASFRKQRILSKSQDLLVFMIPAHGVAVRFLVIWATLGSDNYIHKPAVPLEINPKIMQPEEYRQPYKLYKNNINSTKQGGTKLLVYYMKLVCIAKRKPLHLCWHIQASKQILLPLNLFLEDILIEFEQVDHWIGTFWNQCHAQRRQQSAIYFETRCTKIPHLNCS